MIYLHKLLPLLLSPIVLILILMGFAAIRRSRAAVFLAIGLLYAASTPILSDKLFRLLEQQQVRRLPTTVEPAQAIVVLSGMLRSVHGDQGIVQEWGEASDRFFEGIELFKAGKAPTIVFSDGRLPWQSEQEAEGQFLRTNALKSGVPDYAIAVTPEARNTKQESIAVRKKLGPDVQRIILVTSAYHMARSKRLFEQAGFNVTPYPVDLRVTVRHVTPMDFLPNGLALWMTDIAIREWVGRIYYAVS